MRNQWKRTGVAVVAATSLAATGALAGHAASQNDGAQQGEGVVTAAGQDAADVEPRGRAAGVGVMLATEDYDPVRLVGDFDGDGTADQATLTTEFHVGDQNKRATCWVSFDLSGPTGSTRQGVPMRGDLPSPNACMEAVVTDFDGDSRQGVTLFQHLDSDYWQGESDVVPGEVNIDGVRTLHGLADAAASKMLHFVDVNGDKKTDLVAQDYAFPFLVDTFHIMVTPGEGNPTWERTWENVDGYFGTVADIDPSRAGAEIIYRGRAVQLHGEDSEEGTTALRCMVNLMYIPSGDKRAIIEQDAKGVCPAEDLVVGEHNGQRVLSVGWHKYFPDGEVAQGTGTYATLHQPDSHGVFHPVADYPAPVAKRDRVKLTTGSHVGGCVPVMANDLNMLGGRIRITGEPSKGTASVNNDSTPCIEYRWEHAGGGTDELEYVVEGPGGVSEPQRLIIESEGDMPPAPVAHDDSFTMEYGRGEMACLPVQENDDNAAFSTIELVTKPSVGAADVLARQDGSSCIAYNRRNKGGEPASFTYRLSHMGRTSEPATVTVTMAGEATPPQARDDVLEWSRSEVQPDAVEVLTNDAHAEFGEVAVTRWPENGGIRFASGGTIDYVPHSTSVESDSFEYEVTTSAGRSTATVTVTRTGDMPAVPVAVDDRVELTPRSYTQVDVLANDDVVAPGAVTILTQPSLGSVVEFDSEARYTLPEEPVTEVQETSFTYSVSNIAGTSAPATVTIVLLPEKPTPSAPVAVDDRVVMTYGGNEMGCIPVLGNDTNVQHGKGVTPDRTEIEVVTEPTVGMMGSRWHHAGQDVPCIEYERAPGAVGNDEFTYKVKTEGGESNVATVRVIMRGTPPAERAVQLF